VSRNSEGCEDEVRPELSDASHVDAEVGADPRQTFHGFFRVVAVIVDGDQPAGFADRIEHAFLVERNEGAQIDHLGGDALFGELFGGGECQMYRPA